MKIECQTIINAPAADAWKVLGEQAGDIGRWTSVLLGSSMNDVPGVGAIRTCYLKGGKQACEVFTQFDPVDMVLAYEATEGKPSWLLKAANHWSVEPLDAARCRIWIRPTLVPVWWLRPLVPLIRFGAKRMLRTVADELRHAIEQGTPHPRTRAASQKNSGLVAAA